MQPAVQQACITVEAFHRMGEAGILNPAERMELVEGEIWLMAPTSPEHAYCVLVTQRRLERLFGAGVSVRSQNPVRLGGQDEPVPDLAVVRGSDRDYMHRHPGPDDILLLVEVSRSTLRPDQDRKLPRYAGFAVPEVWLIDLVNDQVSRHSRPGPRGYGNRQVWRRGEKLTSDLLPGLELAVDDLLPERA